MHMYVLCTMPLRTSTYVHTYVCTEMHLRVYIQRHSILSIHMISISHLRTYIHTYVRMQCTNLAGLLHSLPPLGLYDPVPSQPHLGQQTVLVVFEGYLGHKALPLFIIVLKFPLAEGVLQSHLAFLQTGRKYICRHQENSLRQMPV